jgi:hypothetical protein
LYSFEIALGHHPLEVTIFLQINKPDQSPDFMDSFQKLDDIPQDFRSDPLLRPTRDLA